MMTMTTKCRGGKLRYRFKERRIRKVTTKDLKRIRVRTGGLELKSYDLDRPIELVNATIRERMNHMINKKKKDLKQFCSRVRDDYWTLEHQIEV